MSEHHEHSHFKEKDAIGHVAEAQALGLLSSSEIHGTEIPGHISAGADAAREIAFLLISVWCLIQPLHLPITITLQLLSILSIGLTLWKFGRSSWLGWSRLERLHRVLEQERWEIEHHRQQERDELRVLYAAKGFEGKLLEEVLDVLMADDSRLLRIMVEEELGLSLESHEHPLKQGVGALLGSIVSACICLSALYIGHFWGIIIGSALVIAYSAAISAKHSENRPIQAIVWNLGIWALSFGTIYFLLDYIFAGRNIP
jgi:hypothetical protein